MSENQKVLRYIIADWLYEENLLNLFDFQSSFRKCGETWDDHKKEKKNAKTKKNNE